MICPKCNGEMNPINVDMTILECLKCNHRQHIFHQNLHIEISDIDIDQNSGQSLPVSIKEELMGGDL